MSAKEQIIQMINSFSDEQLNGLLLMLKGYLLVGDEADDAYCKELYQEYLEDETDNSEQADIADFAKELGISLQ